MPQAWAALPVSRAARLGEQVGAQAKACLNNVPLLANLWRLGGRYLVSTGLDTSSRIVGMDIEDVQVTRHQQYFIMFNPGYSLRVFLHFFQKVLALFGTVYYSIVYETQYCAVF